MSNLGRVKSIKRKVNAYLRRGTETVFTKRTVYSRIMAQRKHKNGYMLCCLKKNNVTHTFLVHRLVLNAFKPTKKKLHCNHKNLIKHDNRLENLEWVTRSENMQHAVKHGRMHTEKHMLRYKKLIGNKFASKKKEEVKNVKS